jgi:hypothetical protein
MTTVADWKDVPNKVADLLRQAVEIRTAYEKIASQTGDLAGTLATWDTDTNMLVLYRAGVPATKVASAVDGRCCVLRNANTDTPDWHKEILIKTAVIPVASPIFNFGNKVLGGPTPLSNGIVSGLMLGGLGYGTGALAENLFPERYLARGKLRKNLALAGLAAGAGLGLNNAYATSQKTRQGLLKSLITRNDMPVQLLPGSEKVGFMYDNAAALFAPTVAVPQFNAAVWNDVQNNFPTNSGFNVPTAGPFPSYTPPAYAAAAAGLMSGISMAQRSPIIRPVDVIRGIASAGVGLATANVAGRALSAMAGLTPAGQQKLQDMGLWSGMMHAIIPSIFN